MTINLVDVACSSYGDMDKFWKILDERLELCHRALRCRHERLKGTVSDVAPILWQHGALARLDKGEKIDKLLYDGYSTISLGYAGLYEMCVRMTGKSHTDPEARDFALAVMKRLNDKCGEWKVQEHISYSVYGTPMESTTYKFAKCLQKRFGVIQGVTDKNYITNSYHIHVTEEIDAFSKLSFESEFQKLSPGGAISYVEVPNMQDNIPAVLSVMRHIYENIMYAELNTKSDFCDECGYSGEVVIKEDDSGKLMWQCPNCGCHDQTKLLWRGVPVDILEPSSGTRDAPRRSETGYSICKLSADLIDEIHSERHCSPFGSLGFPGCFFCGKVHLTNRGTDCTPVIFGICYHTQADEFGEHTATAGDAGGEGRASLDHLTSIPVHH